VIAILDLNLIKKKKKNLLIQRTSFKLKLNIQKPALVELDSFENDELYII